MAKDQVNPILPKVFLPVNRRVNHTSYPVNTISSYIRGLKEENEYHGNGILFSYAEDESQANIIACFKGQLYWVKPGKTHKLLPDFKPKEGALILRVIHEVEDILKGKKICFPYPGYFTYENIDRNYIEKKFPELFKDDHIEVSAGAVISRAPLVDPDNFLPAPGQSEPYIGGMFRGFVLKTWRSAEDPGQRTQLIYPHVYMHHLRFHNSSIDVDHPMYETLRFGISDSVGLETEPLPANRPHDLFLVYRRLFDLGFTMNPFPAVSKWDTGTCAHFNDCPGAHKGGKTHGAKASAYNRHPPAFSKFEVFFESQTLDEKRDNSSIALKPIQNRPAKDYAGMLIVSSAGDFNVRKIIKYNTKTKTAQITPAWGQDNPNKGASLRLVDIQQLTTMIKFFQSILLGRRGKALKPIKETMSHNVQVNGRIDLTKDDEGRITSSFTEKWLWADEVPRWVKLSDKGDGYQQSDQRGNRTTENHHNLEFSYGTIYLKEAIRLAGKHYHKHYHTHHPEKALINTNDASYRGGGFTCEHSGHETGLDVDIRLPLTEGEHDRTPYNSGGKIGDKKYDGPKNNKRITAFAICAAFASIPSVTKIFFNDPQIYNKSNRISGGQIVSAYNDPIAERGKAVIDSKLSTDGEYVGMLFEIILPSGDSLSKHIKEYDGSAKIVTLDSEWDSDQIPKKGSEYSLYTNVEGEKVINAANHHDHIHINVNPPSVTYDSYKYQEVDVRLPDTWIFITEGRSPFDKVR